MEQQITIRIWGDTTQDLDDAFDAATQMLWEGYAKGSDEFGKAGFWFKNEEVLKKEYRVTLHEEPGETKFEFTRFFMAENEDDAAEQALMAYPGSMVKYVEEE